MATSNAPRPKHRSDGTPRPGFDWRTIAYQVLASRALDDAEELTNKNKTTVPKEHLVLYQFSARGHDVRHVILDFADAFERGEKAPVCNMRVAGFEVEETATAQVARRQAENVLRRIV